MAWKHSRTSCFNFVVPVSSFFISKALLIPCTLPATHIYQYSRYIRLYRRSAARTRHCRRGIQHQAMPSSSAELCVIRSQDRGGRESQWTHSRRLSRSSTDIPPRQCRSPPNADACKSEANWSSDDWRRARRRTICSEAGNFCTPSRSKQTNAWSEIKSPTCKSHTDVSARVITRSRACPAVWVGWSTCCWHPSTVEIIRFVNMNVKISTDNYSTSVRRKLLKNC